MGLGDFFGAIEGAVTRAFAGIEKFLLLVQLWGLNLVEVLLFIVFIVLLLAIILAPLKAWEYFSRAVLPFRRALAWLKK